MFNSNLSRAGVAILLLVFCYRLWGLGIAHHDDAVWLIASHQGNWKVVEDFAISQGRVWALVSGAILYVSIYFHGTLLGDLLRVGSLAVFFVLLYRVASIYFGQHIVLLAATFNLALFALRWEGSIATSYPAIFWILGSVFLCSVWLGWHYTRSGRRIYLYASLTMLFVSLFVHEGVSVLLAVLFLLSTVGNYWLLSPSSCSVRGIVEAHDNHRLIFGATTVVLLYFALYFAWRLVFPSSYEGNTLGSLSVVRALPVLISLSTSGSILSDIISPYSVNFADAVSQDGFRVTYRVLSYLGNSSGGLFAWIYAMIVYLVVFSILATSRNQQEIQFAKIKTNAMAGLAVGGLIAILPILPVALVAKYQQHYYELGVHSYAFTALSHFGVTLSLASAVIWFCVKHGRGKLFHILVSSFVAVSIAVLALCAYRLNDEIANDIGVEQSRWRAVDRAMPMAMKLGSDLRAIYAPRLQSGSWFTVVDANYWSQYVATFHHKSLLFYRDPLPDIGVGGGKLAYMDFMLGRDGKQMIVFLASLTRDEAHGPIVADRIVVSLENPSPSDLDQYVLSFKDRRHGVTSVRFSQLEAIDKSGSARIINGLAAEASSIRFERHSIIQQLLMQCAVPIEVGTKVLFGTSSLSNQQSCGGGKMLWDGWHVQERLGVWSKLDKAIVALPTAGLKHGTLVVTLDIGTYVGLGFTDGTQQISIHLGGKMLTTRIDKKGAGLQTLRVTIPSDEWVPGEDLNFILSVDHTINPARNAISADERELGVYLSSLEVESI